MKRKALIIGVAGFVLIGGAVAFANDDTEVKTAPASLKVVDENDGRIVQKQEAANSVGNTTISQNSKVHETSSDHKAGRVKGSFISKEEAIKIAINDSNGKIVEVEYDDGHYEIEVINSKYEIEYEIDAYTGRILEKDIDDNDDDRDDWYDDDRYDD